MEEERGTHVGRRVRQQAVVIGQAGVLASKVAAKFPQ